MLDIHIKGKNGEMLVINYLERKGYTVIQKNFVNHRGGEIDIVAAKDYIYHFIEVKPRLDGDDTEDHAFDSFTYSKQRKLIYTVNAYLSKYQIFAPYQIDLVIIYKRENKIYLKHFENVEIHERLVKMLW